MPDQLAEEPVKTVESKLQAFHDGLSEAEKPILQEILSRGADDNEVVAHGPGVPGSGSSGSGGTSAGGLGGVKFTLFGKPVVVSPSDGGGGGTNPNAGKDGTTVASQPGGTPSGGTTSGGISIKF